LKSLVLAYGNIDRQDDGVAWHTLVAVIKELGFLPPDQPEDEMPLICGDYTFDFHLQLTPELADTLGSYDKVCFIDAHTGNVPEEIHLENVLPQYQSSPFTHHMTAATLMSLCQVVHHHCPPTLLASVRGYEFKFTRSLSKETAKLVEPAASQIINWLNQAM
jgi:hydrogenase maturation protease